VRALGPWLVVVGLGLEAAGQGGPVAEVPPAPALVGKGWLNATNPAALSWASRKGKVTVVEFWTFDCINCRHNLPYYAQWHRRFGSQGLEIIGIHTPETAIEHDSARVAQKVKEFGIDYPVLLDPDAANWNRWQIRYWPTIYLVDKHGRVRYCWEGELEYQGAGGYAKMTQLIETLLKQ
jgi:thiol-disulfide isomerase/thioredoxin